MRTLPLKDKCYDIENVTNFLPKQILIMWAATEKSYISYQKFDNLNAIYFLLFQ